MKSILIFFVVLSLAQVSKAQIISGNVTDSAGNPLAFATIEIPAIKRSTTANSAGVFSIQALPGIYTITCQHIGYQREQKQLTIEIGSNTTVNFSLRQQQLVLSEVIVKKGEDPAYEIIRNAIKKRSVYEKESGEFTTEVYTKGQMQLRDFPKKFFGQKVDFEDGDTSKKKMIYLSETISKYSKGKGDKTKVEVIASKVSGQSNSFGLSAPQILSFYTNNIQVASNLNPRGFVSPIAENALTYYRYKYEGAFFEDGKQISRIKVTPKRKFEPLFTGYINIVEDEWRIHSLQLALTKSSGMELIDTLRIEQLMVPAGRRWVVQKQVLYPAIKMFGFDAYGSFINVYSNYDLAPTFEKDFFDRTVLKYTDSANKKTSDYWNENRPIVLQKEEVINYLKGDSLEQARKSPAYLDSIDRIRNKITLQKIFLGGLSFSRQKKSVFYSIPPLIQTLSYNTVEGVVVNLSGGYYKRLDTSGTGRRSISITPEIRYGFSNEYFNANLSTAYTFGKKLFNSISVSGGTDVFQFNNAAPVGVFGSTFGTLLNGVNNLKIYEAVFGRIGFTKELNAGISFQAGISYQDRRPLENTTNFSFVKKESNKFTPNRPLPQFDRNIEQHQAFIGTIGARWRPGTKYIEYPGQKISIGSGAPTFNILLTKAFKGIGGGDVDYSKWLFGVTDVLNLNLLGAFHYRINIGGFLQKDSVAIPDYIHYQGNMSRSLSGSYLDRFQLVPHYYFSNRSSFYSLAYIEHHFNGLFTNKIPGIKKLKWNLVAGFNGLYINNNTQYLEPFVGLENIFKIIRIDYIQGFGPGTQQRNGIRVGIKTPFNNL